MFKNSREKFLNLAPLKAKNQFFAGKVYSFPMTGDWPHKVLGAVNK